MNHNPDHSLCGQPHKSSKAAGFPAYVEQDDGFTMQMRTNLRDCKPMISTKVAMTQQQRDWVIEHAERNGFRTISESIRDLLQVGYMATIDTQTVPLDAQHPAKPVEDESVFK